MNADVVPGQSLSPSSSSRSDQRLLEHGWTVVQLGDSRPVRKIQDRLTRELRQLLSNDQVTLEDYHRFVVEDEQHFRIQGQLTEFLCNEDLVKEIIAANLSVFSPFVSCDLNIQRRPHLRITRPARPRDNVGFHRDTFYGDSPWALNVSIPFVDVPPEAALHVLSGSHVSPETDFPTTQYTSPDVTKGSLKHKLGFPYAPKAIPESLLEGVQPVPLRLGEAVAFSAAIVHGSVENRSETTRWTCDVRLINALAPKSPTQRDGYYESLTVTPMTQIATRYNDANRRAA